MPNGNAWEMIDRLNEEISKLKDSCKALQKENERQKIGIDWACEQLDRLDNPEMQTKLSDILRQKVKDGK